MPFGWVGRILEVDLSAGRSSVRDVMPYAAEYLGGRAMASRIAWEEMPSGIDAYHPENRLIVATGPFTGTLAPTSGRTVMAGISPRVYPSPWYTHSTLGGWFGAELKYAGFDAVVIHGAAASPVCLEIQDGQARLLDASDLWGLDARQTQLRVKARQGARVQVLAIGPAGENRVRFATVQHSEDNAAGHSGFGAVWGSKNLKAISVRGSGGVRVADPDGLFHEVFSIGKFKTAPAARVLDGGLYHKTDTTRRVQPICSQACIFNCQAGNYGRGEDGRLMPAWCIPGLVWMSEDRMQATEYSGGGVEIPASQNFGLCEEAKLQEACNSLGLDAWFRLVMQPWFIRCRELGVHQIRGMPIEPNDLFWFNGFMHQLAYREGLGAIFAEDLIRAMDELEGELPDELIDLGRRLEFAFGFPAHREGRFWDEMPLPFWVISAMMYASESRDPSIGAHSSSLLLANLSMTDPDIARRQFRLLSKQVWGYPDALEPTFENKAPVAIWSQHQHMLIDSLPLCDFAFPQLVRPFGSREEWEAVEDISGDLEIDLRLLSAVTGVALSREEITRVAERAFTLERIMLAQAGRKRDMEALLARHFKLPCRTDGTVIDEVGFSGLLDEYYAARGWDLEHGWPQARLLEELGLEEAIPQLERLRKR